MSIFKSHTGRLGLMAASLAANAILIFLVATTFISSKGQREVLTPSPVIEVKTNFIAAADSQHQSKNSTNSVSQRFHWSKLESEEYPAYVANLRRVGCPERTIQDIVLPEIGEHYEIKLRELRFEPDFWINGPARKAADRERERQLELLHEEYVTVVKEILGLEWVEPLDGNRRSEDFFMVYLLSPTLSIEDSRRLSGVIKKYEYLGRNIRRGNTTGSLEFARNLLGQFMQEVSTFVRQEEIEELRLRVSMIEKNRMAEDLMKGTLSFSGEELKKIAQFNIAGENIFGEWFNFGVVTSDADGEQPLVKFERQKQVDEDLRLLLGDARYLKFRTATDRWFKSVVEFTEAQKLPATTSRTIDDIRNAAEEEAIRVRNDASLSPTQRRRALDGIRETTRTALGETLGAEKMKLFSNSQALGWIGPIGENRR